MTEVLQPKPLTPAEILKRYQFLKQEMIYASPQILSYIIPEFQALQEIIDKALSSRYGNT